MSNSARPVTSVAHGLQLGADGGKASNHPLTVNPPTRSIPSPAEVARLAASIAPPSGWRLIVAKISHLWLVALLLLIWEFASIVAVRSSPQIGVMLPPPTAIYSAAKELLARGELVPNIVASLTRVLTAVGVAAAIGVPLGLIMGWTPRFRVAIDPLIEFIRPIPPLAWIPLSILWFGIGNVQVDFIIFLAAFFPIVLSSMAGARDVDVYLLRAGLSMGARRGDLFRTVVFPAALPMVFTGLRVGLGIGWMALVAGELVAAPSGLGYMINNARTLFRSDIILLGMVLIGVLGLVLDIVIRQISRYLMPWYNRQ